MREERKRILTQWMFPTLVLIIVIVGMIINFYSKSQEYAAAAIEKDMIVISERYSAELFNRLNFMAHAAMLTADTVYSDSGEDDVSAVTKKLNALVEHSPAYLAVLLNEAGVGIAHTGEAVNLSGAEYFAELLERGDNTFVYAPDDYISDKKAVAYISSVPEDTGDFLIAYYPIENIGDSIRRNDFDGNVLYMLLNKEGELISQNKDYQSNFLKNENVIETLRRLYSDDVRRMEVRMKNGVSASMKVALEGEARSLVYTRFPINDWQLVIGATEDYVSRQEDKEWEFARKTLLQLAAVISGFVILMVIINMLSKLRSTATTKVLIEKADTDLLTGLYNKVATEKKVQEYLDLNPEEQSVLFVLDIDNFKKINDTMGHVFGDEVLRSLGLQITPQFRASDIIGRIGGDELIIFLKNINNDASLIKEANKVARFFHDFKAGEYVKYSATASIGVAIFPRDGKDFEALYKAADQALYMAKKRGKNQLAFYHDAFEAIVVK